LPKYLARWPLARRAGTEQEWWQIMVLSLLSNVAASCETFVLENITFWLWW
jgi:hypothetical protein